MSAQDAQLDVRGLTVGYRSHRGAPTVVVRDVDLTLDAGRILGLAGESGCGKSTAALAAMGYRAPGAVILGGSSRLGGEDLLSLDADALAQRWGRRISYVAQDAAQSLNPLKRVGWLLRETLAIHLDLHGAAARERALAQLESVGIAEPEVALGKYPHEFSGGQQQRISLALAMVCEPRVLVLDEPTTGLDVTTQAQISRLIERLVAESGVCALYISHDLALLATLCDEIAIMYGGEIVERGSAADVYATPRHPYAAALLDALPEVDARVRTTGIPGRPPPRVVDAACAFADRCRFVMPACSETHPRLELVDGREVRCLRAAELTRIRLEVGGEPVAVHAGGEPQLIVENLRCVYGGRGGKVAVDGVSLAVAPGETLGVVGESGSGKSTLLAAIAGLHPPAAGTIAFEGAELASRAARRSRAVRGAIQLVFQNPDSSLNPRHTIGTIIERPLQLFRPDLSAKQRTERARALLDEVRLGGELLTRYPGQLSGGQKQRVALARGFAAEPRLILCDEVVSALDVSVQATVLELLATMAAERQTAVLFVTHDLAVVRSIADRVCVMRGGRECETRGVEELFSAPGHEYTRTLLDAVPRPQHALGAS
jgi:peptide/nickel transport system ATP-binding protein